MSMNRRLCPILVIVSYFLLCATAFGVFLLIPSNWLTSFTTNSTNLQTIAVLLTGAAIIWYTWETKRLREETQRQTEFQIRPFVIIEPSIDAKSIGFKVINAGNGPAMNIRIQDVQIDVDENIIVQFAPILFLRHGDSIKIQTKTFIKGVEVKGIVGDAIPGQLNPKYADRIRSLMIEFQSIDLLWRYSIKEQIAPERMEILSLDLKSHRID